jgi:hypothetical protein
MAHKKAPAIADRGFEVSDLEANCLQSSALIPVMRGLEGPLDGDVEVVGLLLGQLG